MQYMLLIHGDEQLTNRVPVDGAGMSPEYAAYNDALLKAGVMRGGQRLKPTSTAKSVRVRGEAAEVLDGPYADTREQLGGYYVIDVAGDAEAVDWARRCPAAQMGTIEVRPIWPTRAGE